MPDVQDKIGSRRQLIELVGKEHNEWNAYTDHPHMIVDAKEICKCRLVLVKRIKRFTMEKKPMEYVDAVLVTENDKVIYLDNSGWESNEYCLCHLCGANGTQRELFLLGGKFICEHCREDEKVESGIEDIRAHEANLLEKFTKELHSKRVVPSKTRTICCKHLWCGEGNEYCAEHKDPNHPDRKSK